jgi:hypothetical protein
MIYFLKWLIYWCKIIDGMAGVITFGLITPSLTLAMATIYSRTKYKYDQSK